MSHRERESGNHTAIAVVLFVVFALVVCAVRVCYEILNYLSNRMGRR